MKRLLVLILAAVLLLSACASRGSVEEMLVAPALSADQSAVMNAIVRHIGDRVTLKYPLSGDRRLPIQFFDLDRDNLTEAVVFFTAPGEDVFVQLAVLVRTGDGEWAVGDVTTGPGTDVKSVRLMKLGEERFMLVEWSAINNRQELAAYFFDEGALTSRFEDSSAVLAPTVYDLDDDGVDEFCYVTQSGGDPFVLKYVDAGTGTFAVSSEIPLSREMLGCVALTGGLLEDGSRALFVDEIFSDSEHATEIFLLNGGKLSGVEPGEGYDITQFSLRPASAPNCRRLFSASATLVPSATPPHEGLIPDENWIYWYTIGGGEIAYISATWVDAELTLALCVPDAWLGGVQIRRSESTERLISVYSTAEEREILRLKVFTVGESSAKYVAEGYSLLAQSGSFRYYIWGDCPEEELRFVKTHFTTL